MPRHASSEIDNLCMSITPIGVTIGLIAVSSVDHKTAGSVTDAIITKSMNNASFTLSSSVSSFRITPQHKQNIPKITCATPFKNNNRLL